MGADTRPPGRLPAARPVRTGLPGTRQRPCRFLPGVRWRRALARFAIVLGLFPALLQAGTIPQNTEPSAFAPLQQQAPVRDRAAPARVQRAVSAGTDLQALIDRIARRYGVEVALVRAVVAAESGYDPRAVSRAGAIGLMQVMPATAADYGVTSSDALFDPETNVRTGIRHLRRLLDKYRGDYGRAVMAYNAGEGVVDRTGGRVAYAETLDYTEAVFRHYRRNGGTRPTEPALSKVRALRSATAGRGSRLARSAAGQPPAATRFEDLADGGIDQALRADRTDGDLTAP